MKKLIFYATLICILSGCGKTSHSNSDQANTAKPDTSAAISHESDSDSNSEIDLSTTVIRLNGEIASKPVVIDFSATWCPPCRKLAPVFHKWEQQFGKNVTFITIDVDKYPELALNYGATSIPYIILYTGEEGEVSERQLLPDMKVAEFVGYQPDAIQEKIYELSRQE